ncbi:MAG TPA: adenylate/guanylate cyclase domain-containing protein [Alphaproteobacteria bacterium]|nr:adenylate/guanylate cyclase domain-containing protein [Alphaproteobacteria bacterium]
MNQATTSERAALPATRRPWWSLSTFMSGIYQEGMRQRIADAIATEELNGLKFAFLARTAAVVAIAAWLPYIVPPPRAFYYLGFVAAFFVLGLVPYLLRRHRFGRIIKLGFTLLDVILVTVVIIVPPPDRIAVDWPPQMRIRFFEFLYLWLLIVGSALSYSTVNVIWTGLCVIAAWSVGVMVLFHLPDTVRFAEVTAGMDTVPSDLVLQVVLSPTYVSPSMLQNQVVLTAIATGLLAAAVARARRMLLRHTRAELARADLARYVSPDVVDAIITSNRDFGEPTTREVAVLFADIVGFTALAERMAPTRTVSLLTSFHSRACRVVFRNGGTLDKFLGDGCMAVFGTLADAPDAPARAVRCALELQDEIDRWNAKRATRGAAAIPLAIGIHCGRAVVGNVGDQSRLEFTVIGDAVNVASRLERLTREFGSRIAVSDTCLAAARSLAPSLPAFHAVGSVRLAGREQPIGVHVWPQAGR